MRQKNYFEVDFPKGLSREARVAIKKVVSGGIECEGTCYEGTRLTIFSRKPASNFDEVYLVGVNGTSPRLYSVDLMFQNRQEQGVFNLKVNGEHSELEKAARLLDLRVAHRPKSRVEVTLDGESLERIDFNGEEPSTNGTHYYGRMVNHSRR